MAKRHEYPLLVHINGLTLTRVVIDQHYAEKHIESVNDQIILDLVKSIDGEDFLIESERGDFQYFSAEPVFQNDEPFRLVMLLCIHDDYLGVVNVFRVERKKYE